jgi:hypothetical protein
MLREIMGIDRVVLGTDFPYLRRDLAVSSRGHIEASPALTDGERTAVGVLGPLILAAIVMGLVIAPSISTGTFRVLHS